MRFLLFLSTALAAGVAVAPAAARQSSAQAEKAAAAATRAAQKITVGLEMRHGSGVTGTVGLTKIGRARTRITVRLPYPSKFRVTMYPGTDCNDNRAATGSDVALVPTNFNTTGASMSSTIVSIPIEKVQSNYVIDIRDATKRASLAAACAALKH